MSKGLSLTEREKGIIAYMNKTGKNISEISREIGRARDAIRRYLNSPLPKSPTKKVGRPKSLKGKTLKKAINLARNKVTSAAKIKARLGLKVHKRTVTRYLSGSGELKYLKMKGKPKLSNDHKERRLEWALNHIDWNAEWDSVIFSDEKKFNLDGPDGLHYYWHDLSKDEINFSRRALGGGGVMIWAGFSKAGKTSLEFVSDTMNSSIYIDVLEKNLIPFIDQHHQENHIFQQDNAPCHKSKLTKEWLNEHEIRVMNWPALSPDLNPIENLWGLLVRKVYSGSKQFDDVDSLKIAILAAWNEISLEELSTLVSSMHDRAKSVLACKGNTINY
jgi:predicted transcriptional regulator/transposase